VVSRNPLAIAKHLLISVTAWNDQVHLLDARIVLRYIVSISGRSQWLNTVMYCTRSCFSVWFERYQCLCEVARMSVLHKLLFTRIYCSLRTKYMSTRYYGDSAKEMDPGQHSSRTVSIEKSTVLLWNIVYLLRVKWSVVNPMPQWKVKVIAGQVFEFTLLHRSWIIYRKRILEWLSFIRSATVNNIRLQNDDGLDILDYSIGELMGSCSFRKCFVSGDIPSLNLER